MRFYIFMLIRFFIRTKDIESTLHIKVCYEYFTHKCIKELRD